MTLLLVFNLFFGHAGYIRAEEPFWRAKEKLYRRIVDEQEIIVSVTTQKQSESQFQMRMKGGGHAQVPIEFAFAKAMDFNSLAKMSDYVKRSQYDEKSKILDLKLEAYGREAEFLIRIEPRDGKLLHFTVERGELTGLKGRVDFKAVGTQKTEVGLDAHYEYQKLKIPAFFAEFGLEVILKQMAFRIRQSMESEYKEMKNAK